MSDHTTPGRALILARISDARDGETRGVDRQVTDAKALAARLGWTTGPETTHVITENDTSAFKRRTVQLPDGTTALRTVRPGFRRTLAMLSAGQADGLVSYDLDRIARDPRDLEDLIDTVESRRIPVESVTGSLRLATDADITTARIMLAVANKSSRDTARRVARARKAQADEGRFGGGGRRFGVEKDGLTVVPGEAAEIAGITADVLAGRSLRSIAADMNARQVPTVTGAAWTASGVRDMLMSPRMAGIVTYKGQEAGRAEGWPELIPEGMWRGVVAVLSDPARKTSPGNQPRHLGSCIYSCGVCGAGLVMRGARKGQGRSYQCPGSHVRRDAARLDAYVTEAVVTRLAQPDFGTALAAAPGGECSAGLRAAATALRQRQAEMARLFARGTLTSAALEAGSDALNAELADIESQLAAAAAPSPLSAMAGPDAEALWARADLEGRRAVLRELATVTVRPARRQGRPAGWRPGGRYPFDAGAVDIRFAA